MKLAFRSSTDTSPSAAAFRRLSGYQRRPLTRSGFGLGPGKANGKRSGRGLPRRLVVRMASRHVHPASFLHQESRATSPGPTEPPPTGFLYAWPPRDLKQTTPQWEPTTPRGRQHSIAAAIHPISIPSRIRPSVRPFQATGLIVTGRGPALLASSKEFWPDILAGFSSRRPPSRSRVRSACRR